MAQEKIDDFFQLAKDYAKAEQELEVQWWVFISIERTDSSGNKIRLFSYDLPRDVYERRKWIIEWRKAKLTCQYPKDNVSVFFSYYEKRLGNDIRLTEDLRSLISAKAQVTKIQRKIEEYVTYMRENNMFFDEDADPELQKARQKLQRKVDGVKMAEQRLKQKIESIRNSKSLNQ